MITLQSSMAEVVTAIIQAVGFEDDTCFGLRWAQSKPPDATLGATIANVEDDPTFKPSFAVWCRASLDLDQGAKRRFTNIAASKGVVGPCCLLWEITADLDDTEKSQLRGVINRGTGERARMIQNG